MGTTDDTSDDDTALISRIAERAYQFGVACAKPVDPETFDDPVMHNYYLFFIFGAILWLGDNLRPANPLDRQQKLTALAQAMSFLEPESKEKIRALVMMVDNVDDTYAHDIMREGAAAVKRLIVDKDAQAVERFRELLQDESKFPRNIDPDADRVQH
ncbi:MAG: hypothetical protein HKN59_08885 [Gammaproteobacteria bacterium]|nr:hypothetical protein [Gammaproteobacteria bacterium]